MKRKLISCWLICAFCVPMVMTVVATQEPAHAAKGERPRPPKPGPRDDGDGD